MQKEILNYTDKTPVTTRQMHNYSATIPLYTLVT